MDKKELELQVAEVVEGLFNEKEEAEIRRRTEAKLQEAATTISELTSALEIKNSEVTDLEEKASENEVTVKSLQSELEAAKAELETAKAKILETEKALEDISKDRAAEVRMTELEAAGVVRAEKESQAAKIREMSAEEFSSYKDELVSIREAVVSELKKASNQAEEEVKAAAEAAKKAPAEKVDPEEEDMEGKKNMKKNKKKEACSTEEDATVEGEEVEVTTPAQITPGQSVMAALNFEYRPTKDVQDKYKRLGEAIANRFKKAE